MSIIKILSSQYDRELLRFFIKKELVAPYKGSGFGAFWNVLIPFFIMMIYAFVFGFLFGGNKSAGSISNYVLIVVSGFLFYILY